jgi:thymidylate synthase ThyX
MAKIVEIGEAISAELLDSCGGDKFILMAAGESTGKTPKDNEVLMERLITKRHATPFEMCTFIMRLTAPVGIMTQVLRHRAISAVGASTRYGNVTFKCLSSESDIIDSMVLQTMNMIETTNVGGRTRELLHMALPRGLVTSALVSVNLRGLANFFRTRLDSHAQHEIQFLASEMLEEITWEETCPMALRLLEKHGWVL